MLGAHFFRGENPTVFQPRSRECLNRSFAALDQRERRDYDAAGLAHRSDSLQTRAAGRDRIVNYRGLEARLERAFDDLRSGDVIRSVIVF